MGQGSRLIRPQTVIGDGDGLVSHAGIAWLAETADLSGLSVGLSAAMAGVPQRRHDAGRTLAQMVVALADGATCLSDLAAMRAQPAVFGAVGSEATVWRTFDHVAVRSSCVASPRRVPLPVHAPGLLVPARPATR